MEKTTNSTSVGHAVTAGAAIMPAAMKSSTTGTTRANNCGAGSLRPSKDATVADDARNLATAAHANTIVSTSAAACATSVTASFAQERARPGLR